MCHVRMTCLSCMDAEKRAIARHGYASRGKKHLAKRLELVPEYVATTDTDQVPLCLRQAKSCRTQIR